MCSFSKCKVLIVDDDNNYRQMLTCFLEIYGWEVCTACNGIEALEKVVNFQPHLLILDYEMPGMTGIQVCQYLQRTAINITIVLVSGHSDLKQLALSAGILYFISKPFDLMQLLNTIESIVLTQ